MDITPLGLLRNWLPHLPEILLTIALAFLGRTANGTHQDLFTQVIVACARPVLQTPSAIGRAQRVFCIDWPVFGGLWVVKDRIEVSRGCEIVGKEMDGSRREDEDEKGVVLGVRDAVRLGIMALHPNRDSAPTSTYPEAEVNGIIDVSGVNVKDHDCPCAIPELLPVEIEWQAQRPGVYPWTGPPKISDREKYNAMMSDLKDVGGNAIPTMLYFHGGAHCLMDPASHRFITSRLARESGGRVVSVRYRLSPQNVFPAALIDALVAYLELRCPRRAAMHDAVPPEKIVLAGDSSGGGIAASLMLLLLELGRKRVTVRWNGKDVQIPCPPVAGLAMASPWLDVTRCLPSCSENARWDILAPPPRMGGTKSSPEFPRDEVWPCVPPRAETYCEARMCGHPLVSPLAAGPELWRGVGRVYVHVGWEGMQDEAEVLARRVHEGGGRLVFEGFEGMPHCFGVMPWNWAGKKAMKGWSRFCRLAIQGDNFGERDEMWERMYSEAWANEATWISSKTGEVSRVHLKDLGMTNAGCGYDRKVPLSDDEVAKRMGAGVRWRTKIEDQMILEWRQEEKLKLMSEA